MFAKEDVVTSDGVVKEVRRLISRDKHKRSQIGFAIRNLAQFNLTVPRDRDARIEWHLEIARTIHNFRMEKFIAQRKEAS